MEPQNGPGSDRVNDLGLQAERTALAWDRTALAMVVAGALFLRAGPPPYHHPRHIPGAILIGVGAAMLFVAYGRYERRRSVLENGGRVHGPVAVVALGIVTTLFSLASVILVLAGP